MPRFVLLISLCAFALAIRPAGAQEQITAPPLPPGPPVDAESAPADEMASDPQPVDAVPEAPASPDEKTVTIRTDKQAVDMTIRLFEPARRIKPIDPNATGYGSPIQAAQADFSAWIAGADDLIVATFVVPERESVKNYLADRDARNAAVESYRLFDTLYVWGDAAYNGHRLLLISYEPALQRGRVLVFRQDGYGWRRSNEAHDDPVVQALEDAFRRGEIFEFIPPETDDLRAETPRFEPTPGTTPRRRPEEPSGPGNEPPPQSKPLPFEPQ